MRIRVQGFGFRVSSFGFGASGFGFRVSGVGFRDEHSESGKVHDVCRLFGEVVM